MFNQQFDTQVNPGDASANTKFRPEPEPTKQELDARRSFPGPYQNRLIDIYIKQSARH